jgi:uncharacterized protein (DUF885 family)
LIGRLRVDAERVWGRAFTPARFHSLIMTTGSAPLSVASQRLGLQVRPKPAA